jgi:hypothetical protein
VPVPHARVAHAYGEASAAAHATRTATPFCSDRSSSAALVEDERDELANVRTNHVRSLRGLGYSINWL